MASNLRRLNENMEKMAEQSEEFHDIGKAWLEFYATITGAPPNITSTAASLGDNSVDSSMQEEEGD